MGKAKQLNLEEIGRVQALHEEGYSGAQIARKIGRSVSVVCRYLRDPENYGKNYKGGVKTATTERERRQILRLASNSTLSARQIRDSSGTSASVWTVRRILKNCPTLKRLRILQKPPLTPRHQEARMQFARNHMHWTDQWQKVVFSDEKRFSLDGPDGFSHYFHDLRKEKKYLARHHSREGSLMVWGAITYEGPISLEILKGGQTGTKYVELLQRAFSTVDEVIGSMDWVFQHDHSSIHTARVVQEWFEHENITVLDGRHVRRT